MILFELRCAGQHHFEAWFKDGATYDSQVAAGEIACPVCGDSHVEKAPMAPRLVKGRGTTPAVLSMGLREGMRFRGGVERCGVGIIKVAAGAVSRFGWFARGFPRMGRRSRR